MRLLDGAPGAAKANVAAQGRPELVHERIHQLVAPIVRNEDRPSLGTEYTLHQSAADVGVTGRCHGLEEWGTGSDANIGQHIASPVDVWRRDAALNVNHDVVKGEAHFEREETRMYFGGIFTKSQASPTRLDPLRNDGFVVFECSKATKEFERRL